MEFKYERDFSCTLCGDILKDPVLLACSHTVCDGCLQHFWVDHRGKECPVCRRRSSRDHPLPNLVLKNLCETFWLERSQRTGEGTVALCCLHGEKLKLFCEEHNWPVCVVCRFTRKHTDHTFKPIDEEPFDLKEELTLSLEHLKVKVEDLQEAELAADETAQFIKTRVRDIEELIRDEFEDLHKFLRDEESARLAALRKEKEEKMQMLREMTGKMRRQVSTLRDAMKAIEKHLEADGVSFVEDYRNTVEITDCSMQEPDKVSEVMITSVKHLDDLKFQVMKKLRDSIEKPPVTLDSNTVHPELILSEDRTSMRFVENNPTRFDLYRSVLGSEGYDSGVHCWDVEVGDYPRWILGVMAESASRKGDFTPQRGRWFMWRNDEEFAARCSPKPSTFLKVEDKPKRIRVQLDYDAGQLSFFDAESRKHLHTLTDGFPEKVFPYFNTVFNMKVLPAVSGWMYPDLEEEAEDQ